MLPQCRPRVRFAARNSSSDSNPCSRQCITEARSAIVWEDELAAVDWMAVWAGRCESGKVGWGWENVLAAIGTTEIHVFL